MKILNFTLNFFEKRKEKISGTFVISSNKNLASTLSFDTDDVAYKTITTTETIQDHFEFINSQLRKFKVNEYVEKIKIDGKSFYVDNLTQRKKNALQSAISLLENNNRIHIPEQTVKVLNSKGETVEFKISDLGIPFIEVVKNKKYTENSFINNVFSFNDVNYQYNPNHSKALNDAMPDIKQRLKALNDSSFVYFNARTRQFASKLGTDVYMIKAEHFL